MIKRLKAEVIQAYRDVCAMDPRVRVVLASVSVAVGVVLALANIFAGVQLAYGVAAVAVLGLWSVSRVPWFGELYDGRDRRRTDHGRWRRRRRWRW